MGDKRTRDPRRDKDNSLKKDRRNSYGESPHAARKAIPKRKALESRSVRHQTRSDLNRIEFDETGRLTFVDAATGALVITEGECIVRYDPAR